MWPLLSELVESTLAAETAVEDLYAEALRLWAPKAAAAMLPTLDTAVTAAASELPPDPDAITTTQSDWDELMAAIVLPGIAQVWMGAAASAAAAGAVGATIDLGGGALASALDQFLTAYGLIGAKIPVLIRDGMRSLIDTAMASAEPPTTGGLRKLLRKAIAPGSAFLRNMARNLGFHGASILNDALTTVASYGRADRKLWLSRRDSRVRDTHRIADGQIVPLAGSFTVGGADLAFPGDPRGPAREIMNCRCRLVALAPGEFGPAPWVDESVSMAASVASEENTIMTDIAIVEETPELYRTFTDAVIAFIGVPTSDNRMFSRDVAFEIRTPPLPLMWMRHTGEGGHSNAFSVGIIEEARIDDGKVLASGYLLNTAEADEAVEQLKHGITRPSVDLGRTQWAVTDKDGVELSEEAWFDLPGMNPQVFTTFTEAELIGMTLVATPAFGDTKVTLNAERESRDVGLVAAAMPRMYPAAHFTDPHLSGPTLPTMDESGRIYGHIACWGQCHRSVQTSCETAPHSTDGYSHFHTSALLLDDDTHLSVGRLTINTGHAPERLSGIPAQAHYDNTGTCWALVRVGEDAHGIWFSGVAAPWASPEQVEAGLCSPLSGDWRDFGQGLELVAALSVNTPGFAVRGRSDEQGRPVTLVAALGPAPDVDQWQLTREDVKAAVAEALAEASFTAERDALIARSLKLTRPPTVHEQIDALLAKAGL